MAGESENWRDVYVPAIGEYPQGEARLLGPDGQPVDRLPVPIHTVIEGHGPDGKPVRIDGDSGVIVAPKPHEVRLYERLRSGRYCGNCSFYNHDAGARLAAQERFFQRIKHEQGWSGGSRWTGPATNYGLCEYHGDAMVYALAPADKDPELPESGCEFWRPSRGKILRFFMGGGT